MLIIKRIWTFLSELSGVIATFIYVLAGFEKIKSILATYNIPTRLLWPISILVLISLFKWIKSSLSIFSNKVEELEIKEEIKTIENSFVKGNIDNVLPSKGLMFKLEKLLRKKITSWSDDAELVAYTLFIKVNTIKPDILIQAICYSSWKNEEKCFYVGKDLDSISKENLSKRTKTTKEVAPFHKNFSNWRNAVAKAYNSIGDKLPKDFELIVYSHYINKLHFTFNYVSGIQREEAFELEDKKLTNIRTGESTSI